MCNKPNYMYSLPKLLQEFLNYLELNKGLSRNTIDSYSNDLRNFVSYLSGREPEAKLINEYVQNLRSKYKVSTVNRKLSSIRGFVKYIHHKYDPSLGTISVKNLKSRRNIPEYISFERLKKLFSNDRDGLILMFLYATGLRVSELINLRISDIFFEAGFLRIKGKGRKERMVPIALGVLNRTKEYINRERKKHPAAGRHDFLFVNKDGKKFTRQGMWKLIRKKALSEGLYLHPHSLRHMFAVHLLENGADLRSLKEMLGHESILTTQIYTEITDSLLEKEFRDKDTFE